jgi:hypothetical protein
VSPATGEVLASKELIPDNETKMLISEHTYLELQYDELLSAYQGAFVEGSREEACIKIDSDLKSMVELARNLTRKMEHSSVATRTNTGKDIMVEKEDEIRLPMEPSPSRPSSSSPPPSRSSFFRKNRVHPLGSYDEPVTADSEADVDVVTFYNDKVAIDLGDMDEENEENYEFKDEDEEIRKNVEKENARILSTAQVDAEEEERRHLRQQAARKNFKKLALALRVVHFFLGISIDIRNREEQRKQLRQRARLNFRTLIPAFRVVHCFLGILREVRSKEEERRHLRQQAARKYFKKLALALRVVHFFLGILTDVRSERENKRLELEERIEELEHQIVCPLTFEVRC